MPIGALGRRTVAQRLALVEQQAETGERITARQAVELGRTPYLGPLSHWSPDDDRIVDALCDPPESFVLGSVLAHVLTFAAHRRQLVRAMLRVLGHEVDQGDPIEWLRAQQDRRTGGVIA